MMRALSKGEWDAVRDRDFSTSAPEAKVGFIGLGAMGMRMATRLLGGGHSLLVHDSNHLAVERLLGQGGAGGRVTAAASPAEVAATPGVSVVFTMLSGPSASVEVYTDPVRGLLAPQGGIVPRVLVDCSTLDPPTARMLAGRVRATRVSAAAACPPLPGLPAESPTLLDAPVSGGVVAAEQGTLEFLVGGDEAALPALEPMLRVMGGAVTWCGDAGDAQAARLCNSLVTASIMAATCEALALARRLGVDPAVMTRVLSAGSGRSWVVESYNPVPQLAGPGVPAAQGYRGGLRSSQLAEHLALAVRAAEAVHSPVPVARRVAELYGKVVDEGMGDQDFASLYRYVYGSGASGKEWRGGETLFGAQHP